MKRLFILLLLIGALLAVSCGKGGDLPKDEERTAVLFSSLAEIWTEAGGKIHITVGETVERSFAPEGTLLVDDGAGKSINTELLLSYRPTRVICSSDIPAQAEAAELLSANGIEVISLRVECFSDYLSALDIMTDITGNKAAYENAVSVLGKHIDGLLKSERINELSGTRILFMRAGSTESSTKSKTTQDHFAAAMLSKMGCVNIADDAPLSELGMEAILYADPEYIFFSTMGDEEAARKNITSLLSSDAWSALSAVKEGRVIILPKELFHFKPCSRWGEAYDHLADALTGEIK